MIKVVILSDLRLARDIVCPAVFLPPESYGPPILMGHTGER